jgi:hypothetical protein
MNRINLTVRICTFIFLFCTCKNSADQSLNFALNLSGENRLELEKVLTHYKSNQRDTLKYKAAVFLIKNMPYHSYKTPINQLDKAFDYIQNYPENYLRRGIFPLIIDSLSKDIRLKNPELIYDIKSLKAEFIINNIELAFNAWRKIPISKKASFDEFCNYILPYRCSNEPLESNSRKKLFDKYSWVYRIIEQDGTIESIVDSVTSEFRFNNFQKIRKYYPVPLSISQIQKSKLGLCDDGVNYLVNVFRSLGIVCSKDYISQWGNHNLSGHSWIYTKYGNQEYSTSLSGKVDNKVKYSKESIPKVYRLLYRYQNNLNFSPLATDVTDEYVNTLKTDVYNIFDAQNIDPFLCVFNSNTEWKAVTNGSINNSGALSFEKVGTNVLYLAATIHENQITPINYPFFIDKEKHIHFFKPVKSKLDSVTLTRKTGLTQPRNKRKMNWLKSFNGSFFEGSNDSNFKKSTKLYEISNLISTQINKIDIGIKSKFKYIRFNANGKESFLAKLAFYGKNNIKLKGKVIKKNTIPLIWENGAYDNDPLSFSGGKGFTLGLKLNTPKSIGFIEFQARNDDNHINIGENYELFYWDKKWQTLGEKIAKDTLLSYNNVPKNSLLWLRNLTKGKEEHVFTVDKNGNQKWLGFDNY